MPRFCWPVVALLIVLAGCADKRSLYSQAGAWRIEGNITSEGALSYVLSGTDEVAGVGIEFWCQPAREESGLRITGPFRRFWSSSEEVNVAFTIDEKPPRQVRAMLYSANAVEFPREKIGISPFWLSLRDAKQSIRVSVNDVPAIVSAAGFSELEPIWKRLCVGDPIRHRF